MWYVVRPSRFHRVVTRRICIYKPQLENPVTIPMLMPLEGENTKSSREVCWRWVTWKPETGRTKLGGWLVEGLSVERLDTLRILSGKMLSIVPPVSSVTGCSRQTVVSRSPWLEEAARDYRYVKVEMPVLGVGGCRTVGWIIFQCKHILKFFRICWYFF